MATSLLTGLLTDTSSFSNAATNPIAMAAASAMLAAGARHGDILRNLMHNKTIPSLKLLGKTLARLRYNPEYDMLSTYVMLEDMEGFGADDVEGTSNFLGATAGGCDAIMTLRELPGGTIKGSFRSIGRDVSKLAKLMGGGGHKKAAGFTVSGRIKETPAGPMIVQV
jgi:phosphoesterase RecJ-like protein